MKWDKQNKIKVLLKGDDKNQAYRCILDPRNLSSDGEWVRIGGFFSDDIHGNYRVKALNIVSVL